MVTAKTTISDVLDVSDHQADAAGVLPAPGISSQKFDASLIDGLVPNSAEYWKRECGRRQACIDHMQAAIAASVEAGAAHTELVEDDPNHPARDYQPLKSVTMEMAVAYSTGARWCDDGKVYSLKSGRNVLVCRSDFIAYKTHSGRHANRATT